MAGMAHHSESTAIKIARQCVEMWDSTPAEARDLHHNLAAEVLSHDGAVRSEVDRFIAGCPRSGLSSEAQKAIAYGK